MCEKIKITFELDGKRYESAPAITTPNGHLCDGCAFEDDEKYDDEYCTMNVPVCQDVIYKEVQPKRESICPSCGGDNCIC